MEIGESNPIGYAWLTERFGVIAMPHWKESRALTKGARRSLEIGGRLIDYFPAVQNPGDDIFAHLEFALRKEGLHLELLRKALVQLNSDDLTTYIRSKPTSRYARILWWLFESFAQIRLDLPDAQTGNYVDLLDPIIYVTGPVEKVKRQRVNVNLLGSIDFSPMVRKKGLGDWDEEKMRKRCEEIVGEYPPELFQRAIRYLYAKESKSSHEIERESPDQKRAGKFIGLLEQAWQRSFLTMPALIELQQAIVDSRYANSAWRDEQIYIGETLAPGMERVHFAAPKSGDLNELMTGFFFMARNLIDRRSWFVLGKNQGKAPLFLRRKSEVSTVVAATVISFTFNFLHPFSDGNGRIHRFLLHHVLAHNEFGPRGIVLPISAVILNRPREYDQALESFSKPLMDLVNYTMNDRLQMTVTNDTVDFYRYIDCTELTRITIGFLRETIETELVSELQYLKNYDGIRQRMRDVVEMPDRIAALFVKLCQQNGGKLSERKRRTEEFASLTDTEIERLEILVRKGLGISPNS